MADPVFYKYDHGHPRSEDVVRQIQTNLLECKVCFEKFNTQQRECRPHNLSCGHVLCLECIRALSNPHTKTLECPFCRHRCNVDGTSPCQVLTDLQELLSSRSLRSPVLHRSSIKSGHVCNPVYGVLHLASAVGGWGTLVNPTGIAVFESSGAIVVVHDGDMRVVVLGPKGRMLHSFGRRGRALGEICYPLDVAVTPSGYVVVTDAGESAVKVFTSRGNHVLTVKESLQFPWGVAVNNCGHILVTDVQTGTLSQLIVDYTHGVTLMNQAIVTELQQPKAVACCQVTGNIATVEHLGDLAQLSRNRNETRLRVYNKDFQLLFQTDSFSLCLGSVLWLCVSAVTFNKNGELIFIDSQQGMIWSFGNVQNGPQPIPLVKTDLVQPVGLVSTARNQLIVLDSGDHAVKHYYSNSDIMASK